MNSHGYNSATGKNPNFPPHRSSRNLTTTTTIPLSSHFQVSSTQPTPSSGTMKPLVGKGTRESPIVLADDDDIETNDTKPAANDPGSTTGSTSLTLLPFTDDTCAICLDTPTSMTDVATISGCTHKFCFDCIDRWAATENSCPCCKARFRTIDRVVPLTPSSIEADPGTASTSRSSADHSTRRINSRTVEDRRQSSVRTSMLAADINVRLDRLLVIFLESHTTIPASIDRGRSHRSRVDQTITSATATTSVSSPVSVTVPLSALERYRLRRSGAVLHNLGMVQTASSIQAETGLDVNAVLERFRLRRHEAELHGLAMSSILAEAGLDVSEASASSIAARST